MNDPIPIIERTLAAETQHLLENYVVPNYGRLSLVPVRGESAWLWDAEGTRYLDFGGGVAVTSLGHCPEVMVRALAEQSQRLIHCSNWYQITEQGRLAKFLVEKAVKQPGKCFFCNSGAEANEGLLKLARKFGHATPRPDGRPRHGIITFSLSFHGRTFGGISATAQAKVKEGFEPLLEGFTHLPYNDIAALESAVDDNTVAIMLEAVQGEGGVHLATPEFLHAIWKICQQRNILLLIDEVQAGLGRLGHWCGWKAILGDDTAIIPDAVSWAKGIAGGFPLGAVWIRQRKLSSTASSLLCDLLGPGSHGTTYGGNPLGCAVALAVLREIDEKHLCTKAAGLGEAIRQTIRAWNSPFIKEVRGLGFLIGIEFHQEKIHAQPDFPDGTLPSIYLVKKLMELQLLTIPAGPGVVRLLPPLNVGENEINTALATLHLMLQSLC